MPRPNGWRADRAVAAQDVFPWTGSVWRGHSPRYLAIDPGGSLRRSGRFHRAADQHPIEETWPALYTSLDRSTAMGEVRRNVEHPRFNSFRYTEIWVQLEAVLDCRELDRLGLAFGALMDDEDYSVGQELAAAARDRGVEAMLVSSATLMGDNLIIFPDLLKIGSVVVDVGFVDPRLDKRSRA